MDIIIQSAQGMFGREFEGGGEVLPDRYQSVSNYALAIKLSINNNSSYSMQVFFCYEKGPLPFQCTKQWAILILLLYVV